MKLKNVIQIPDIVVEELGSAHLQVEWQLTHFLEDRSHEVIEIVDSLVEDIPEEVVLDRLTSPNFLQFHNDDNQEEIESSARREILYEEISEAITQARIRHLRNVGDGNRPAPYDHPSMIDAPIDKDCLVDLSCFEFPDWRMVRNGHAFDLCPTLPAINSSYWLMRNLESLPDGITKWIRLDPLVAQPEEKYRSMMYKMWLYGVPLCWEQISTLKEDLHGRWMPDSPLSIPCAFTDVVWSPRSNEVHFVCEEVPTIEQSHSRGSWYLHSIYLPELDNFIHIDGALRFFTENEIGSRLNCHARNVGKIGDRIKIFRVEGLVSTEQWGGLASSFFVWNEDVRKYVQGQNEFPEDV